MQIFSLENNRLLITGSLKINNAEELVKEASANLLKIPGKNLIIDLSGLRSIDSAGVAAIDQIITNAKEQSLSSKIVNASAEIKASLQTFSSLKISKIICIPTHVFLLAGVFHVKTNSVTEENPYFC